MYYNLCTGKTILFENRYLRYGISSTVYMQCRVNIMQKGICSFDLVMFWTIHQLAKTIRHYSITLTLNISTNDKPLSNFVVPVHLVDVYTKVDCTANI